MSPRRICMVGSSFVGAVLAAYREAPSSAGGYGFDFFARGGGGFGDVRVAGERIVNLRFQSTRQPPEIAAYDAFVVYADLPSPQALHGLRKRARHAGYSRAVLEAWMRDRIEGAHATALARALLSARVRPTFVLSANVPVAGSPSMTAAHYGSAVQRIQSVLRPLRYVAPPAAIFDESYRARRLYYDDARLLDGERAFSAKVDHQHMNAAGGRETLRAVVQALDEAFGAEEAAEAWSPPGIRASRA